MNRLRKVLKEWGITVAVFVVLYGAVSHFQSRHLIDSGQNLPAISALPLMHNSPLIADSGLTLLYAFAPWCGVCKADIKGMDELDKETEFNVRLLAFDYQDADEIVQYRQHRGLQSPMFLADSTVAQALKIKGYPTYYLVNSQGEVIATSVGFGSKLGVWARSLLAND